LQRDDAVRRLLLLAAIVGGHACMLDEQAQGPEVAEIEQSMSVCADGPTTYGIDVSRFQGDIDWQKVKNSGVEYAFIQISRSLTDIDAKFAYNWKRAKEVGILRGAYQRFQPGQDVIGQAKLFVDKLEQNGFTAGDLPPVLDVEDANGLTAAQIAARVKQWMEYVEPRVGLRPIIYTGFYFWRDSVGGADFTQHPLWIANYSATCPLVPQHWTRWTLHQYSSSATIPGITANTVDVNRFNGTLAELKALATMPACGDSTCNGAETADSCASDCAPCQMIDGTPGLEAEGIVDDTSACFGAGGDPQYIREEAAGYGSTLKWTHTTDAAAASNYGRWALHFKEAGRYRVEAFTPAPFNGSRKAVYQVRHGETVTKSPVDQSAVDGWNLVGEFDFVAGGHGQYVRVDDNTGEANTTNTQLVFDALRFTRVDLPDDGEPPVMEDAAGGGCTTGGGTGWLMLLLVALAISRGRTCRYPSAGSL
jgi:lysozyme